MTGDMRQRGHAHVFFGLSLIFWGVLAVLANFGVVDGRGLFRHFWPALGLFGGVGLLLVGHAGQRFIRAIISVFGAAFLLNQVYVWHFNFWAFFWPLILIVVGLRTLFFRGRFGHHGAWHAQWHAERHAQRAAWRAQRA